MPRNKFMFKGHNPYVLIIIVTKNLIYVHYEGSLVQDPSTEPTKPSNKLARGPKAKLTLHRVLYSIGPLEQPLFHLDILPPIFGF